MSNLFKGFLDSYEEIHYLIGGFAIGLIIGIVIMLVVYKLMDKIFGD